jgi:hypothetical protein
MANMPFFSLIYGRKMRPECGRKPQERALRSRSTAPADMFQPRIDDGLLGADRINIFSAVDSRNWSGSRGRNGRSGSIVAAQAGDRVRYRSALDRLCDRGLAQRANRDEHGKKSHFVPFID